jgi:integrase
VPIEAELLSVIEDYLDSRASRRPATLKSRTGKGLSRWPANTPLFVVGRDGQRITRGTIQSRVRRAFRRAGPDAQPVRGALVHGLRHTYATELANSEVSVYTLMKLLGHESMATSQRYVAGAARETRTAAAQLQQVIVVKLHTSATDPATWSALGERGLDELRRDRGEEYLQRYGYRLGAFVVQICVIFRPRTVARR